MLNFIKNLYLKKRYGIKNMEDLTMNERVQYHNVYSYSDDAVEFRKNRRNLTKMFNKLIKKNDRISNF